MVWKSDDDLDILKKNAVQSLLGFEDLFNRLITMRSPVNYPLYNIEKFNENEWCIVIAVAGFKESDLDVSLDGMQLMISGTKSENDENVEYLYKGIANRSFQRSFLLAHGIKIDRVLLLNGLLKIFLTKQRNKSQIIKIPINSI